MRCLQLGLEGVERCCGNDASHDCRCCGTGADDYGGTGNNHH